MRRSAYVELHAVRHLELRLDLAEVELRDEDAQHRLADRGGTRVGEGGRSPRPADSRPAPHPLELVAELLPRGPETQGGVERHDTVLEAERAADVEPGASQPGDDQTAELDDRARPQLAAVVGDAGLTAPAAHAGAGHVDELAPPVAHRQAVQRGGARVADDGRLGQQPAHRTHLEDVALVVRAVVVEGPLDVHPSPQHHPAAAVPGQRLDLTLGVAGLRRVAAGEGPARARGHGLELRSHPRRVGGRLPVARGGPPALGTRRGGAVLGTLPGGGPCAGLWTVRRRQDASPRSITPRYSSWSAAVGLESRRKVAHRSASGASPMRSAAVARAARARRKPRLGSCSHGTGP